MVIKTQKSLFRHYYALIAKNDVYKQKRIGSSYRFLRLFNLTIYFLTVALCEEIVYRGYIGTRLYGLIKNQYCVVMVTGILFIVMHFPYRMLAYNMTIADLTIYNLG